MRCDVAAGVLCRRHFTVFLHGLLAHNRLLQLECTPRRLLQAPEWAPRLPAVAVNPRSQSRFPHLLCLA